MIKKKIQKSFDIKTWENGAKIETRDGYHIRIICTNLNSDSDRPIVAAITYEDGYEDVEFYYQNGQLFDDTEDSADIVIVEENECDRENLMMETSNKINTQDEDVAHWQEVRERAAIAAMQGILSAPVNEYVNPNPSKEQIIESSIALADELIKSLKR